jgi:hypothetical protein
MHRLLDMDKPSVDRYVNCKYTFMLVLTSQGGMELLACLLHTERLRDARARTKSSQAGAVLERGHSGAPHGRYYRL